MIRLKTSIEESISFTQIKSRVDNSGLKDEDKIFKYIMKYLDNKDEKYSKLDLEAYGSSEKELKSAIKGVLMWNKADNDKSLSYQDKESEKAKALQYFVRNVDTHKGKLNDSKVLKLAKSMLDDLTDDEYEVLINELDSTNDIKSLQKLKSIKLIQDDHKKLFMIDDKEVDRFYKSKDQNLRGLVDKGKAKRKIKKAAKDVAGRVTDTVDKAVQDAKDRFKGVVNSVKDKYNKVANVGKYISGWLT